MLSKVRFNQIHKGLPANAKKVYEAIPISEPWSPTAIQAELARQGIGLPFDIMQGCVRALVEADLVKESSGRYARCPVKPAALHSGPELSKTMEVELAPGVTATVKKPSATDRLADLGSSLRNLASQASSVAEAIDELALELEENDGVEGEELKRLRKLRDAMREAGLG
jgi:hypothetical protein